MTTYMSRVLVLIAIAAPALGQTTSTRPAFEVATIKVNTSGDLGPKVTMLPGGRFAAGNTTLKDLVTMAYRVKGTLITGGAKWVEAERFDVIAKAPPDAPVPTLLLMVQTLLEERFKLAFHREDKVMSTYVLMIGNGGPKLRPATEGARETCASQAVAVDGVAMIHRDCHHTTMAEFVRQLGLGNFGMPTDRPVVDGTHLAGAYDFAFEYRRPQPADVRAGVADSGGIPAVPDLSPPTIFDALETLGMKIETSKQPVPVMVIDHAESPVE